MAREKTGEKDLLAKGQLYFLTFYFNLSHLLDSAHSVFKTYCFLVYVFRMQTVEMQTAIFGTRLVSTDRCTSKQWLAHEPFRVSRAWIHPIQQ